MVGTVEKYLLDYIHKLGAIHLTLIDPEKVTASSASRIARKAEECKTAAIMVGGSTSTSATHLDSVARAISRTVRTPVILFPNNVTGISKHADAIWFMSLLNSVDPYFLIGAQVLGAPMIKRFGLEAIPLGYIIVGEGGTAGVVGKAVPIPYSKPELAAVHALAAQYFGMRFVYLEAGSGASHPVSPTMIRTVKESIEIPLIVGGGIRDRTHAKTVVAAGADVIVTGNIVEETGVSRNLEAIVRTVRENGRQANNRVRPLLE
jgi:phosphoglycerol geranylgeranyltransferase